MGLVVGKPAALPDSIWGLPTPKDWSWVLLVSQHTQDRGQLGALPHMSTRVISADHISQQWPHHGPVT